MNKIGPNGEIYKATVVPADPFDAASDAKALHDAMKGLGTDEDTIINILGARTYAQRMEIKDAYISTFGSELTDKLKSELKGNFEKLVLALFKTPAEHLANCCYKAIAGLGTDEKTLAHVLGTATNQEIRDINQAYMKVLEEKGKSATRNLQKDIIDDCGGVFRKVLVALVQGARNEPTEEDMEKFQSVGISSLINIELAKQQVAELYNAGEGKLGTDESKFVEILCKNSVWQIAAIDKFYQDFTSNGLVDAIEKELSGDLKTVMKVMVKSCLDRPSTYAELLHKSMAGLGTDDESLIRLVVSRSEVDLESIKQAYEQIYGKTLKSDIEGDCSGDHKKLLIKLIGEA